MAKLKDMQENPLRKVLLMGNSGAGKTVYCAGAPGPIYYFDFDNKISSVAEFAKGSSAHSKEIAGKLDDIEYDVYAPVRGKPGEAGKRFNAKLEEMNKEIQAGTFKYKTIVIDSMTTMVDEIIKYLMMMNPGVQRGKTNVVVAPSLQDYQMNSLFIKDLVMSVLNFPCNVIFTAHIARDKDETTGEMVYAPLFPGKLAAQMPIYFEEVHRAYVDKDGRHRAQVKPDQKFTTIRSQINGLAPSIPLHFSELIK